MLQSCRKVASDLQIPFCLFPASIQYMLLPSWPFTPKHFSICFLHDHNTMTKTRKITLVYHLHLAIKRCRSESSSAFSYYISLFSFSLKQFLNLWPSWAFEDYSLVSFSLDWLWWLDPDYTWLKRISVFFSLRSNE